MKEITMLDGRNGLVQNAKRFYQELSGKNLISYFFKPKLTEKNVIINIRNWKTMMLDSKHFAKEYVGIEVFQKRDDLRQSFLDHIEREMKQIVASDNPLYFFRRKVINTIKIQATNSVLLGAEFDESREKICDAINRGMKSFSEHWNNPNISFEQAIMYLKDAEAFSGEPWNYTKITHKFSWSEVEGLALRHMQALLFLEKVSYNDWWHIYKQACEIYFGKLYRLVASNANKPEGYPHPFLIAMADNVLMDMEDTILKPVEQ